MQCALPAVHLQTSTWMQNHFASCCTGLILARQWVLGGHIARPLLAGANHEALRAASLPQDQGYRQVVHSSKGHCRQRAGVELAVSLTDCSLLCISRVRTHPGNTDCSDFTPTSSPAQLASKEGEAVGKSS